MQARSYAFSIPERVKWLARLGESIPGISYRLRMSSGRSLSFDFLGGSGLSELGFTQVENPPTADELFSLIHPEDVQRVQTSLLTAFTSRRDWRSEFRFVHGEKAVHIVTRAAAAPGLGDMVWDGVFTDVSKQRAREAMANEAVTRAEAANRTKSLFLANISHELRTPLNAIIGFAEMMTLKCGGAISERYLDYATNILNSGKHLLTVINDLLDLSKAEAGAFELQESNVDVRTVINLCKTLMEPAAEANDVDLVVDLQEKALLLYIDPIRFQQILLNLLSNAIKFTPPGGAVTTALVAEPEEGVVLTVTDTGCGIDAKDIERSFQPFQQGDQRAGPRHYGTGLGLPLTALFAKMHGGTLTLSSEAGKGTVATLTLPPSRIVMAG